MRKLSTRNHSVASQDARIHALEVVIRVARPLVSALVKKTARGIAMGLAKALVQEPAHHVAVLVAWGVPIVVLAHAPIAVQVLAWVVACILVCLVLITDKISIVDNGCQELAW